MVKSFIKKGAKMKKITAPEKLDLTVDAVVIGGGMVGVATSYYLSKAGMDVICLEMRDGLATLTSSASIEAFRLQFTEPAMYELCSQSLRVLLNLPEELGLDDIDLNVHQQGYLFMTADETKLPQLEDAYAQYQKLGVDGVELLNQADIQKRFPYVDERAKGATFREQDGWLSFHEAMMGFVKAGSAKLFHQHPGAGPRHPGGKR
jgi:sarcosine oxidase subunit beta